MSNYGFFAFTALSNNAKTGHMPVSRSNKATCPNACPLKGNGCYAENGHANIHWSRLDSKGLSYDELCRNVKKLGRGTLWRHNESGDLVGHDDVLDKDALYKLVAANSGKRGFTYTHYPINNAANLEALQHANKNGFTVNVSCETADKVKLAVTNGLPAVLIVGEDTANKFDVDGIPAIICPAQIKNSITCSKCGLCQKSDRNFVIGFRAHGTRKRKVINIIAA